MALTLYRNSRDNRVHAFDDPNPDLAARPGWSVEANHATPDAVAAIAALNAERGDESREAALVGQSTTARQLREVGMLVLGKNDAVPAGTAADTVIIRRTT